MAESESGGGGKGLTIFFVVIFLVAALNYLHTGSIKSDWSRYSLTSLSPLSPYNGETSGGAEEEARRIRDQLSGNMGTSPYRSRVRIENYRPSEDPNSEYITLAISGSSTDLIPISGWTIESDTSGRGRPIPKGVILPTPGNINAEQSIYVRGGEKVILVSGRSPTGYSFKVNSCSGYFSRVQTFTPYLDIQCPRPEKYNLPTRPNRLEDRCLDYLDGLPACFLPTATLPQNLSMECQSFIADNYNYNSCVSTSKNRTGFYKNEWRVYLNSGEGLWKSRRETIKVIDAEGRLVTSVSY